MLSLSLLLLLDVWNTSNVPTFLLIITEQLATTEMVALTAQAPVVLKVSAPTAQVLAPVEGLEAMEALDKDRMEDLDLVDSARALDSVVKDTMALVVTQTVSEMELSVVQPPTNICLLIMAHQVVLLTASEALVLDPGVSSYKIF